MSESWRIEDLEVVGYADSLSPSFVPTLVAPIFRLRKQPKRLLMPPFRVESSHVAEATPVAGEELDRAVLRGQATRLGRPIPGRPGYRLWVDEGLEAHYEPAEEVREKLRRIARGKARAAQEALANGEVPEALRLSQAAISADDGCLNAILVKALAHRLLGHEERVETLARIAETIVPSADFGAWIDFFSLLMEKREGIERLSFYDLPGARASFVSENLEEGPNPYDASGEGREEPEEPRESEDEDEPSG